MNSITFGRYSPQNTFTHKLDPRNKIFLMIALLVIIFFQFNVWSTTLLLTGVYLICFIAVMILSKVSFLSLLKSLSAMWFFILIIFAIYIFIPRTDFTGPVVFNIGYDIHADAFYQSGYIVLRLILMFCLTMVLTSTTKPLELTYAFEWYMTPLGVIKFPVQAVSMMLSLALRFVPTLLDETRRIMNAQSSRGADFVHGGLFKKFKAVISLIIPLFTSALQRSDELSDAMEARGYDPHAKRTRYRKLRFGWRDLVAFLFVAAFIGGIIALFVIDHTGPHLDLFKVLFNVNLGW